MSSKEQEVHRGEHAHTSHIAARSHEDFLTDCSLHTWLWLHTDNSSVIYDEHLESGSWQNKDGSGDIDRKMDVNNALRASYCDRCEGQRQRINNTSYKAIDHQTTAL